VFTKFALLENKSKSLLVNFGFEVMGLKATKSHFFAYVQGIE
jgi:hypothetical protein